MADTPDWLPEQLEFEGDWQTLLSTIYARFVEDIVQGHVRFRGRRVAVRKHPPADGKEYGFWHCISEGATEAERIPDPQRCRRIGWIRAVIENCDDPLVESWVEYRGNQIDHILWFREEYVVVLSERGQAADGGPACYLLKTAFCTLRPHQRKKKRRACDAATKGQRRPARDGV
jgi:hypothetical protein